MGEKRWDFCGCNAEEARRIAAENNISSLQAALLYNRAITAQEDVAAFFDCDSEAAIEEPFALADMDRAVERIEQALDKHEKICIFGDYDVDGICATVMLFEYLSSAGADVGWMLPSREGDGYGFSKSVAERLFGDGVNLVITVDNGIAAASEVALARQLGMDVVVTDHHMPPPLLPDCITVDPHRLDCPSVFKDLCGAGVVFKLICALCGELDSAFDSYGDLLALATVADIVPLLYDNRAIVKRGLGLIAATRRPGLKALSEIAGFNRSSGAYSVSFGLAPRINAAGRVGNAEDSAELLLATDPIRAHELAKKIDDCNALRHSIEQKILDQAEKQYFADDRLRNSAVIIVAGEGWETGVAGIVAARMVEKYSRPCAVFGIKDGSATGSARAPEGFSLYEAFGSCRGLFDKFGGHDAAVGMTLPAHRLGELFDKVNAYADAHGEIAPPALRIDGFLQPEHLSLTLADEIEQLEPFGRGNPQPLFCVRNLLIRNIRGIKNNEHCILELAKGANSFMPLLFGTGPDGLGFACGDKVDVVISVSSREYNGNKELSVIIKDIRRSGFDEKSYFSALSQTCAAVRRSAVPPVTVSRAEIGDVFRYFKVNTKAKAGICLKYAFGESMDFRKVCLCTEILTQLGLIKQQPDAIVFVGSDKKLSLEDSPLYELAKER